MQRSKLLRDFGRGDDGALTILGLFLFMGILAIGGLSLDVANAYKARTELQVAADAASHAALYTRELGTLEEARARAIEVAEGTLLPASFGNVLQAEDIQFGTWDRDAGVFTVDNNLKNAVMVNTARYQERGNSVASFLLNFVGIGHFDVRTGAVYETYVPTCFREGFVAQGVVDVQSNNTFTNGFCVHSNTYVEVSTNNSFGNTTIVSMPDKAQIVLPNSGYETNDGLEEALREGRYNIRILNRLADIINGLEGADPAYTPNYITSSIPVTLPSKNVDASNFTPHRIHTYTCTGGSALQIAASSLLKNVVLVTNCVIKFGQGVTLENSVVATTNTGVKSVTAASGVQIGKNDGCAVDGGSQILTMGGVDVPADLKVYGGQIIAMKDIQFAANANGIEGASFISGGKIDGTSNMTMGFCGSGWERNFEALYFHLRG